MLIAIPLVLTSTGYALFSQQLDINADTAKPAYSRSQNLLMTYDKVVTVFNASRWEYNLTITVRNEGTADINSWHLTFSIPSNANAFKCFDDTVCTLTTGSVVVDNGPSTGTIPAGGSVSFTMRYRLTTPVHTAQNINISGTYAPNYQTMAGLTQSFTRGSRSKSGGVFYWPYTFTITNNTGQNISAWRILAPWDTATNALKNVPATINYFEEATQLTMLSTTGITSGGTFQFTISLGSTSNAWNLSGQTIQGAL
jgi:hypothetical protein